LGNRSIISLADSKKLAKKVNEFHKGREWYRPLAPIMLEKDVTYFTESDNVHHLSKYMLLEYRIKKEKIPEIAGAVHIDNTARIQVLFSKKDNPFMYDLLSFLDNKYQVKSLINTSFNSNGSPMVHTKDDALEASRLMRLDALIYNGKLTEF